MEGKEYICFECGHKSNNCYMGMSRRKYKGYGYDFELQIEVPHCERCKSPLYDRDIEEDVRQTAHEIIRKQLDELNLVKRQLEIEEYKKGFKEGFSKSYRESHDKVFDLSKKLGIISVARRMKESGYPESEIEKLTDLTPDEISDL